MTDQPLPDYMDRHRAWIDEQVQLLRTIKQNKASFGRYHRGIDKAIQAIAAAEKAVGDVVTQQGVLVGGDVGTPQTQANREAIRQHIKQVCPDDGLAAFNLGMNLDIAPILFAGMRQKLEEIKAVTPASPKHNPSLFTEAYLYLQMQKHLTKPRRVSVGGVKRLKPLVRKWQAIEIINKVFEQAAVKQPSASTIRSIKRRVDLPKTRP